MNVSDYRRDYAAYCSAVELAHYQHRAGFERELNLEQIYDRYGILFTRDAINDLEHACHETSEQRETERTSLNNLIAVARAGYLDARARELTDELARCTSAASVTWNDESVPVNNIPKIISNEAVATRRRELAARWMDALRDCDDLRAARFETFHESARTLGFDSYRALLSDITGVDYERLATATRQFLARTESAYTSTLARAVARDLPGVSFDDLQYADYFYFRRMARLDPFFPSHELMATYSAAMADLGIHVEQQSNIHIDDVDHPFKNPRAACFRIKPPDDVRLLIAPVGGASDYTVLFHEAGHAQHFAWSSRD